MWAPVFSNTETNIAFRSQEVLGTLSKTADRVILNVRWLMSFDQIFFYEVDNKYFKVLHGVVLLNYFFFSFLKYEMSISY